MRTMMWLSLVALCSCRPGQVESLPQLPPNLTAEAAREAIANFISSHPDVFASPGRAESAEDIRNVKVSPTAKETISIGMFHVDLQQKTYQLMHRYGKPGEGWFEHWQWTGKFLLHEDKWELSEPEFMKEWGK
jgi:hypothetical protein